MFSWFPGQMSRFRSVGLAGLCMALGTAVVALPGPAMAAGHHKRKTKTVCRHANILCSISTRAVRKNQGFRLRLTATQSNEGYPGELNSTAFNAILTRKRKHVTQTVEYSFSKGIKLTGNKSLTKATIKGTLADGRGSISMTFHSTGPERKASVPKACRAGGFPGHKRSGVLRGSLTLKADKLGTVRLKSVKTTLSTAVLGNCTHSFKGYLLEGTRGEYYVKATKPSKTGSVAEQILVNKSANSGNWAFAYTYTAFNEPSSDYTVGSGLSTATLKGASGINGTATYQGKKSSSYSNGKLTGNLSVNMAALGVASPFSSHSMTGDQRYHKPHKSHK